MSSIESLPVSLRIWSMRRGFVRGLTFEVRVDRRQEAKPGPVKMYPVPPARAWWPAVGPHLDRRVRPHWCQPDRLLHVDRHGRAKMTMKRVVRLLGRPNADYLLKCHTVNATAKRTKKMSQGGACQSPRGDVP